MKKRDIISRAHTNIINNKSGSFKIIVTIFMASLVVILTSFLYMWSNTIVNKLQGDKEELLTIDISGTEKDKKSGVVDMLTGKWSKPWGYNEAKKVLDGVDESLGNVYMKGDLNWDLGETSYGNYIMRASPTGVSFKELQNLDVIKGNKIKDTNGVLVSEKFLEVALDKEKYENGDFSEMKDLDLVGKTIEFKVEQKIQGDLAPIWKEFKFKTRIDGIISNNDARKYSSGVLDQDTELRLFNDSIILFPMERIFELSKKYNRVIEFGETSVIIEANNVESMGIILEKLDQTQYSEYSIFKEYTNQKYLNFLLKLIFLVLGVGVIISAVVSIANISYLAFMSKLEDIKKLILLRINIKDLKSIHLYQNMILIFSGIFLSILPCFFITFLRSYILQLIFVSILFFIFISIISILPCYIIINKLYKIYS